MQSSTCFVLSESTTDGASSDNREDTVQVSHWLWLSP